MATTKAISSPMTKSQLMGELSERTGFSRKECANLIDELYDIIGLHLKKRGGAGTFTMPGLLKIKTVKKPARKARKGINPFTGEETMFKAKPASTAVKVLPLKNLKEMAN